MKWEALLALGLIYILLATGCTLAQDRGASLNLPPDYKLLSEIDLSARYFYEDMLGKFTLDETVDVGILYNVQNIDTGYFDLSLTGPDDDRISILHSETCRTDKNGGGKWEHMLQPGSYQLVLTADQSPGILLVYWGYH